jgi:hypothetical protein
MTWVFLAASYQKDFKNGFGDLSGFARARQIPSIGPASMVEIESRASPSLVWRSLVFQVPCKVVRVLFEGVDNGPLFFEK